MVPHVIKAHLNWKFWNDDGVELGASLTVCFLKITNSVENPNPVSGDF